MNLPNNINAIFSVDVEEWFHILETDCISTDYREWDNYESRVVDAFGALLRILDRYETKATLFFLGWIAEKYPFLVREAYDKGHEIAVHGYYHKLIYEQTYEEFYNEIQRTKLLLEEIIGEKVIGYRAPGFSLTNECTWAYKALVELGFKYSSSVFPAKRAHGYIEGFGNLPKTIVHTAGEIIEFPMTVLKTPLSKFSCFGGGFFRLFPVRFYHLFSKLILSKKRLLIFYIHPRDIDTHQPRLKLSRLRSFKTYVNIKYTHKKIESILKKRKYNTFKMLIEKDKATMRNKLSVNFRPSN